MNKLIVIGWTGVKTCYLNIPMEEAILRYCKNDEDITEEYLRKANVIKEFEFSDEFNAYDVWG